MPQKSMPQYVCLLKFSEGGVRAIKGSPQRLQNLKNLIKDFGGKLNNFYILMGEYDFILLLEMPNDEAMATLSLSLSSGGSVRATSLKAFTEAEFKRIVDKIPETPFSKSHG
ncbi:MAG: GYD domain-containing protein [Rhodospirillales bacterium]